MLELIQDNLLLLGVIAGALQLIGYLFYISDDAIDPNPVTWFMFAYGTGLLTILEWDKEATIPELILPTVCSVLAIYVSYRCWRTARNSNPNHWWPRDWWPEDTWERWSFISDILITIGYIAAWGLTLSSLLTDDAKEIAVFVFLFLSVLSTYPAFYPIIRSTWNKPEREAALPWIVWSLAYAFLSLVTYATHNEFWHILMFYPVSNLLLHIVIAVLAARR